MLKFQNNHTTTIETFEDFILIIFVIIDELYKLYIPTSISKRRNVKQAKLSDSEKAWFSFVKRNYIHLFPKIGSRSRFNRTRRALLLATKLLCEKLLSVFSMPCSDYFIIDSFPLPVCKFERARYCHTFRAYGANYGRYASQKETYYGYKVYALMFYYIF